MRAVLYARFSTELQREASIGDQFRNCERFAAREGWQIVARFEDQAISGMKRDRAGYQALLAAAKRGEFDVLVVDDLSRLSRDEIEIKQTIRRFRFAGLRIVGISDGFDTDAKGHKIQATVRGMLNEIYLDDLAEKTHRGLTGRALEGFNAGGRSYGYRHLPIVDESRRDEYGRPRVIAARREVDTAQAVVVREIFELFAAGRSPRAIAHELNRRRIPAPRGGTWAISAIYGDRRAGVGILNNPLYVGRVVWNRSRWARDPDSGRRRRIERPESEWIVRVDEALRIVPAELWERAQARMHRRTQSAGRHPNYLFSGLLRCGTCGGPYVKVDGYRYGCSAHKDRGPSVCANGMKVAVKVADRELLAETRHAIATDEALDLFRKEASALLRASKRAPGVDADSEAELAAIEREISNMVRAIKAGAYSEALQQALTGAEAHRAALQAHIRAKASVERLPDLLPRAAALFREMVKDLDIVLAADPVRAREQVRALLGDEIRLIPRPETGTLEAQLPAGGLVRLAAKLAAGAELDNVVAGACYGHYLIVSLPASGRTA